MSRKRFSFLWQFGLPFNQRIWGRVRVLVLNNRKKLYIYKGKIVSLVVEVAKSIILKEFIKRHSCTSDFFLQYTSLQCLIPIRSYLNQVTKRCVYKNSINKLTVASAFTRILRYTRLSVRHTIFLIRQRLRLSGKGRPIFLWLYW